MQSTVQFAQGAGIAGELFSDAPHRGQPFIIVSDPVVNKTGLACTVTSEGIAQTGGSGVFAGILGIPKSYASSGAVGDPLAPTIILPDQTEVEMLQEGEMYVL
ncbi:MAG: hypothetical protein V4440_02020, partial [Pseudomonadota bacterium]